MCTWAVLETVGYFLRNGSDVYTCQTDMTKAFDMVRHSLLFCKLINAGFPKIFIRIFMFIYMFKYANVCWNGVTSSVFSLCNGVRQGAILSGILYCFYVNNLFSLLRRKTSGCWVNNVYHGIFGYSDDNWVLSPSLSGLQEMLKTIEEYCTDHNLKFSTDPRPDKCKTKCIAFTQKDRILPPVYLNGNPLPWVNESVHLGNYFSSSYNGMSRDISVKKAMFIQKNCELLQEFAFAHPTTKLKTIMSYNCHFTGSPLWDLFGDEAVHLEKAWNICIRKAFDLPRTTHRYFIEPISDQIHLKKILIMRFVSFIKQIEKSSKMVPKCLLNIVKKDTRSITGHNIRMITLLCNAGSFDDVRYNEVRKIQYAAINEDDLWKVNLAREIIDLKHRQLQVDKILDEELDDILDYICTS